MGHVSIMESKHYLFDNSDHPEVLPFFATLGLAIGLGWLGGMFLPMYYMLDMVFLGILWFGMLGGLAVVWAIATGIFDEKPIKDIILSVLLKPIGWSFVGLMSLAMYLGMIEEFEDFMLVILPSVAEAFGVMMGMWAGANYIYGTPRGMRWADASVWIALFASKFLAIAAFMDWFSDPVGALTGFFMTLPNLGLTFWISAIVSGFALMWWNRQEGGEE